MTLWRVCGCITPLVDLLTARVAMYSCESRFRAEFGLHRMWPRGQAAISTWFTTSRTHTHLIEVKEVCQMFECVPLVHKVVVTLAVDRD